MSVTQNLRNTVFQIARMLRGLTYRPDDANCIVVLQYMLPLGGCVHATPLFAALHNGQPLQVYVATRSIGLDVLRHNPNIAGLIDTPDVFNDLPGTIRALRLGLAKRNLRPRWTIMDAGNQRSRIAMLGVAVGAPMVGYSQASGLLHAALERDSVNRTMIADNLAIATAIGVPATFSEPTVFTSPAAVLAARTLLATANPDGLPVVIFATQGSGGQPTQWHTDRLTAVVRHVADSGMLPIFVGTAAQASSIDELQRLACVPSVNVAGQTDIPSLAALLALADLCIAIDSGPMHMARGSKVPLIVLAPTYQSPVEWLPLEVPTALVLRGNGITPAPPGYMLDEIEVEHVEAAITQMVQRYPPGAAARESRVAAITTTIDHRVAG